jgi:hypothetical protein
MKQVLLVAAALLLSASSASADRLAVLDSEFAILEAAIAGEAAVAQVDPQERCLYYEGKVQKYCFPENYNQTLCYQYEALYEEWCKKAKEAQDQSAGTQS